MRHDRSKALPGIFTPDLLWLGLMLFASGSVGLVYEGAWQREFTLLFGSSAPATAAVLAAYFAGLGLGSLLLGRFAQQVANPLKCYALLECAIGVGALLVTPVLSAYADFYPSFFSRFEGGGTAFLIAKSVLAFAAIAIPTVAMGGTLPILAQLFERRRARFGELAGWLYLANTTGAAVGIAGFPMLLAAFGMRDTVRGCIAINFVIAAGAILLAKRRWLGAAEGKAQIASTEAGAVSPWVGVAFLSGFTVFALQIGWSRALAQVHENSIYSFSTVVAIFIAAIAIGAELARWLLKRKLPPKRTLGAMWIAGGMATVIAPFLFVGMTGLRYATGDGLWIPRELIVPLVCTVVLPVVFLATGLPLILQHAANRSGRGTGEVAGMVLAANIAGCVAGALAAGFLFPAVLGLWRGMVAVGTLSVVAGVLFACKTRRSGSGFALAAVLAGGLVMVFDLPRTRVEGARGEQLLGIAEGAHGISAVVERSGSRRLKLNNHYVLGGTLATGDERMQAHIPLLLRSGGRRIVFLGYGTGITARTAAYHPVNDVLALELVPEVVDLAPRFFRQEDVPIAGVKPQVLIEDARNFLRGTRERFDVIIGDLVVPWRPGEGALYTLEQFTIGRERLAPGGIYCAWLPMFQLSREDFESILATFQSVFASVSIWRGDFSPNEPALALIGSARRHLHSESVSRRLEGMHPDGFNPQLKHERAFWMHLVGFAPVPEKPVPADMLNTADKPRVELRRGKLQPFVGRALQSWEKDLRARSQEELKARLGEDAFQGWQAGALMTEFTHLTMEQRGQEAAVVRQQLRAALGDEAAKSIFGQ